MQNKIEKLKLEIENRIKELQSKKEEVGFSKIIKSLKEDGDVILEKKIASKRKDISDEDKKKLLDEIANLKEEDKQNVKKLDSVSALEKKLFDKKNNVTALVSQLDKKRNAFDYKRVKFELELEKNEQLVSGELVKKIEKEMNILEKKLLETTKEISKAKEGKYNTEYLDSQLKGINNRFKELNKDLVSIDKSNIDSINARNEELKNLIAQEQKSSDEVQAQIDQLLELLERINKEFVSSARSDKKSSFVVEHLDVWYGSKQALFDVNVKFPKKKVIAVIGPSGCGKSTFLRTLNRINDNIPSFKAKGRILLDGEYDIYKLKSIDNIYDKMELPTLRTKVGMIFQQPNPFPMTIAKNVQYGPRIKGINNKFVLNELTEQSLKDAGLWEEVRDNLKALGTSLSGGQQQRLCIARAIANEPEILLMDEPTSALDPIATKKIEDLIVKLKKHYTIIMVTHSMQQAQRISDHTAFFYQGNLVEFGTTKQVFENPKQKETKEYISGKFG